MAADRGTAQPEPLDAVLELLSRQIRMLQRDRRERDEAIRMSGHPLGQPLVLDLHDPAREVAIGCVPPVAIDTERLNIEPLLVHDLQARWAQHIVPAASPSTTASASVAREACTFDDVRHLRHEAVTVDVDHLDALAPHEHLAAPGRGGPNRSGAGIREPAAHEHSGRRAHYTLEEVSAIRHVYLSRMTKPFRANILCLIMSQVRSKAARPDTTGPRETAENRQQRKS